MTTENPYIPPSATVADPIINVPADILKKIRNAWIAALFSAGATLAITLLAMSGMKIMGFSEWELLDVALILGLAIGIYFKSRTCAVLMLVYFVASKIFIMVESGKPTGALMAAVFIYFYWQGVAGTFAYHKFRKSQLAAVVAGG